MQLITYRRGDLVLVRGRVVADVSNLHSPMAFAPVSVEETYPTGAYFSHILAPFSEIGLLHNADDLLRLRKPVVIDPTTARR